MNNFWHDHGIFFLIFMMLLPRLTLLLATATPFGFLAWIGFFIGPRVVAAYFATVFYGDSNPFLVAIAWIMSIGTILGWLAIINQRVSKR